MSVEEFLRDPGSTTGHFSQLSLDYRLDILSHGISGDNFERIIVIYLDARPSIIAISKTKTKYSVFLDILQNAGNIPIGTKLFAHDSKICRANMEINSVRHCDIRNLTIANFVSTLNIIDKDLPCRTSDFIFEDQTMHLDEYVLPGLIEILQKTSL